MSSINWKKLWKRLICPPVWLIILLTVISAAALTAVFMKGLDESPIAYAVYVLSFYSLSVLCVFLAAVLPKRYRTVKKLIYDHPIGNRYMTDAAFKTHISLYGSLTVNLLYAATNLFSGVYYGTAWSITLAAYYMTLAIMRFLLLRFIGRVGIGQDKYLELRRARLCGIVLMPLNIVLSGEVILVVQSGHGFQYNGMLIYIMAMYAFYVTTQAIINIVKYRRYNSPVLSASKLISLTAALVSMLSLETAMFHEFGQNMAVENRRLMIILTGIGVGAVIVTMSVITIVRSTTEINRMKGNTNEG